MAGKQHLRRYADDEGIVHYATDPRTCNTALCGANSEGRDVAFDEPVTCKGCKVTLQHVYAHAKESVA